MATNYVQEGKSMYLVTITGAKSGDPFVVGDFLPGVLLTDADAGDSHKATVATEGVFKLSAKGDVSAISAGDMLYWVNKDTPLDKTAEGKKPFGVALEASTHASNSIDVMLVPKSATPAAVRPQAIADPGDGGAIPVTASGVCAMTTEAAETRTLAIPTFIGQQLVLTLDVDGGDAVVTVAEPVDVAGNNTLTFNNDGETIALVATQVAGDLVWRIFANDGVVLSIV